MSTDTRPVEAIPAPGLAGVNPGRLFLASCMSLISTAVVFAVVGDIVGDLKRQFVLDNEQAGYILGARMWGFTISIFILGPLCDALGMRLLMRIAFLGHFLGVLLMVFAQGFWSLFFGALVIALGNGTVEAACNPLVATIYPDRKTEKLNQFHVWFPGGIVIGGIIAYLLTQVGLNYWQLKLAVVLVPTAIYGVLFTGQVFPLTERVQSGVSFGQMIKETLARPLFIVLFVCMMITASLELGPQSWVPSVLQAGGIPGILVLVWITGLMAVLRYFAGPVVHKLSNTGILLLSSILAGVGLLMMSYLGNNIVSAFIAATVFAVGVCYFWPTMLGTAAERVPKGGALALALLGGVGMAVVGLVTAPQMGRIADRFVNEQLASKQDQAKRALAQVDTTFSAVLAKAKLDEMAAKSDTDKKRAQILQAEMDGALKEVRKAAADSATKLSPTAASAFRAAIKVAPDARDKDAVLAAAGKAAKTAETDLLMPADNHGGLMSFRYVAPFSIILIVVFGVMYLMDRARGGYKPQSIHA